MRKTNIIKGSKYGRLSAVSETETSKGFTVWLCQCDCGKSIAVRGSSLASGKTKSCGCLKREKTIGRTLKHGHSATDTYRKWVSAKSRCSDKAQGKCKVNYFLRGINVCERWQTFENFLEDMGLAPDGYELDRINNDGNYEPGNCRWVTREQNQANRKCSLSVQFNGQTKSIKEWAEEMKIPYQVLRYRLVVAGWPTEDALTKPTQRE